LFLDDVEQFSEADEIEYHDTMTKVPFSIHKNANKILIIGGGDGAIARECLKYDSVDSIDLCEIDEDVVSTCKEYFPQMSSSFENDKMNIIYQDAQDFVKSINCRYDIILVDSTDPINQAVPLFKKSFYENVEKILNPNGIIVFQMQTVALDPKIRAEVFDSLYNVFSFIDFFNCAYHRKELTLTLFCLCSKKRINIPSKLKSFFDLKQPEYKKIKDFRDKVNWLKEIS
tara:strand:+ start:2416 stop:3102 length:687 start_codon:yes stop_codon:yes gene_type:complete